MSCQLLVASASENGVAAFLHWQLTTGNSFVLAMTDVHPHSFDERIFYWIHQGGYPALFGVLLLCGVGLPLPEDIPLIAAGFFVQRGEFDLAVACICAWCGIIGGDCILYSLGRK